MANFSLTSAAFNSGEQIPARFTCEGDNISPPLTIGGVPDGAESLVLIMDDPDAPTKTFVHWIAFNLPTDVSVLSAGSEVEYIVEGALEGVNDFGDNGYGGPCPPPGGTHHYHFRLYALDTRLDLERGVTKKQVTQAMEAHILDEANLIGSYERSG